MNNFSSINPATGERVWTGTASGPQDVAAAVARARTAFQAWSATSFSDREAVARRFAKALDERKSEIAEAISLEVGKPRWEALTEVQSMIAKVDISVRAHGTRCAEFGSGASITRFRPHGVLAVFGPFNFPGHLPNGHIVPALLAGNGVVFKPSERAPLVAALTATAWRDAGLPAGVLTLVQGGREAGEALAAHPGIDGACFTGSSHAGFRLAEVFSKSPGKILALEMGGNNPLVVWEPTHLRASALLVLQSAYLSAGQRCTCARRLIVPEGPAGQLILDELIELISRIRVGPSTDRPEPFMGPVVSAQAAMGVLVAQDALIARGARALVRARGLKPGTGLLSPGLIDVTGTTQADEEIFGPVLQVIRVPSFEAAIAEANATRFGLAAGLIGGDRALYERFRGQVRAGIVNWNQPLVGASSAAPFGGIGDSGNHRPSAFFAADYCSYAVASLEVAEAALPSQPPIGLAIDLVQPSQPT